MKFFVLDIGSTSYLSNGLTETHTVKALKTGELVRYCINWKTIWLWWNKDLAGWRARSLETPKIIIQYIRKLSLKRRIISALDESGVYYPLNNYSYIQKGDNDYDLRYIQGVLNSSLINFYFANTFIDYNIKPTYLKEIPIIKIDFDNLKEHQNHQRLVALVDQMLELNKRLADSKIPQTTEMLKRQIETTDNQIDQLVYQLYGLTAEEIRIIESEIR